MDSSRVLVVDDEVVIRNFLVRVLQMGGYTVEVASDGREALDVLQRTRVDLVLTDIRMSGLDGVELLREVKERYPDLAVILLTGHATVPSAQAAVRHGASDYLLKPARNEEILAAVAAALGQRQRELRRDRLEELAAQMLLVVQPSEGTVPHKSGIVHCADLELDVAAFVALLHGKRLKLTPTEFRLLVDLARSAGEAVEYVKLVQSACGYSCARAEAREIIGAHVLNLRKKMGIAPDDPAYVESVRGIGYRLACGSGRG